MATVERAVARLRVEVSQQADSSSQGLQRSDMQRQAFQHSCHRFGEFHFLKHDAAKVGQFFFRRQLFMQQEVADFLVVRFFRQVVDAVPAIDQPIVERGDIGLPGNHPTQTGVVQIERHGDILEGERASCQGTGRQTFT